MSGYEYGGGQRGMSMPGNRYLQLLAQQPDTNNGTHMGGISSMLQKALMGYMMGQDQRDETQANQAFTQGMSAKPWVNPDTGGAYHLAESGDYDTPDPSKPDERMPIMNRVPTGPAGGLEGAMSALSGMQGNPYAGRLSQALMMKKVESDTAAQQAAAERAAQFRNAVALKSAPGWEKPERMLPGRDMPYSPDVAAQLTEIAGAKAAATRSPNEGVPPGYTPAPTGGLSATPGGPADTAVIAAQEEARRKAANGTAVAKPVPAAIVRLAMEQNEAVNTVEGIQGNLSKFIQQIDSGQLDLGLVSNLMSSGKNMAGMSDEQSRNYASFRAGLEKLRNDSLRLNTGVQTDGDAQRAWNELIANLNDPQAVRQRLGEINDLNMRAAAIKAHNLDLLYSQYPGLMKGSERPAQPKSAPPAQASPAVVEYDYDPATKTLVPRR